MDGMHKAVDRLNEAMGRKERVLVYGDYDVDGCTAVALVYKFCNSFTQTSTFTFPIDMRRDMAFRKRCRLCGANWCWTDYCVRLWH